MIHNWTGKLQVTLLSTYISRKKLCSQTYYDVFLENEDKMPEEGYVKEFFC